MALCQPQIRSENDGNTKLYANIASMLNIGIILLENSYCSSIGGLVDIVQLANMHCERSPEYTDPPFHCSFLADRGNQQVSALGGVKLVSDTSLQSLAQFDLLYLPAGLYPSAEALDDWLDSYSPLYQSLNKLVGKGVKFAASCTSTFLLAEAGILDGKVATTTWWLERQFQRRYPQIKLNTNMSITEDSGIYCSGALTTCYQLALRLIEDHTSPEIARRCANTAMISHGQASQTPYHDLSIATSPEDPLISRAQYWLKNHMKKDIDFSLLAKELGISQRTLIRRFKAATDSTPLKFLQNLRLESSKTLLINSSLTVTEILNEVGYCDASAFNRLFKQRVGLTPSAYRQQFSESQ